MRTCVRVYVRACVRACVRVCVRACVRACVNNLHYFGINTKQNVTYEAVFN